MLEARNLSVELGGMPVLRDVTADFGSGRITAICGPNGAGKSTLLRCLAGLLEPSDGEVRLAEHNIASLPARDRARRIGYLPQRAEVAWNLSVEALVALGRLPHGDVAPDKVAAALTAVDLGDLTSRKSATLSGGELARALLARVLAGEPRWILADEPLAALDLGHQQAMIRHFRATADAGTGVILVLHDLAIAMNHADHVLVLGDGEVRADGPPEAALCEENIASVWKLQARWLGKPGEMALSLR